ncbi:HAD family hydrolase [Streptomyces mobaraensis]|uniref:HAD family hydrolase n=1 Tax=Streptomyces mobaraensis TaxID=35621 RepID=UPI0000051D91|nr:HAD family hydrolase [Streptomyces mobaraensis]
MTGHSAIALDVGGVIYYDEPFELAWLQGTFDLAVTADPSVTLRHFIDDTERFYLGGKVPAGRPDILGSAAADESWVRILRAWGELAQEIPGAIAATKALAREIPTAVVANQPPECAGVLAAWGLTAVLETVVLDCFEGVAKPDPRLLGIALDRLGLSPADLLVVGNRADHDVAPARALGCPAVFVLPEDGYRVPPGVHPDIVRAYRALRAVRTAPPVDDDVPRVASLAELAASPLARLGAL